ncbi:hypothetical protein SHKM778_62030 [Streptomyces sp. KM77-8]|uniref:ESX-1 secretion system protein EccA1-like N-terminal domain-containing protein n=1 Tax=Streptomyces haneummycinicus TaxID=3074435 RepID=A0AAT9HQJ6_9ACTN
MGDVMDFGTQGPQAPADLAWLRGVDAYTMGAYPQAEEEFRAAVRIDPGMADGWLGLHALRVDTTAALLRMFRHRERFGEQRAKHRRTLNSWYWLGWWVQPVLESPAICCWRTPPTGWTDATSPNWTGRSPGCPRWTPISRSASCTHAAPIWSRTGSSWSGARTPWSTIRCWASRPVCSAGWPGCGWRCTGRPNHCCRRR